MCNFAGDKHIIKNIIMKKIYILLFAALLSSMTVDAQVTQGRVGNGNITIYGTPWNNVYGLDFDNDGTLEIRISDFESTPTIYNGAFSYNYEDNGTNILADANMWDYVGVLDAGVTVGAANASLFAGYGDAYFDGSNITTGVHYMGFRIKLSDGIHYGYAKYTMTQEGGNYRATFNNCYYNATAGASIVTGDEGAVQRIDDVEGLRKITMYPNPATSWVTVDMEGLSGNGKVSVIDMSGREIMNANTDGKKVKLDVGTLARGTYYVRINDERAATIRKLIVR